MSSTQTGRQVADSLYTNYLEDLSRELVADALRDSLQIEMYQLVNDQLSMVWNPYGVMVASLSAVLAVGALLATVVIWRQGAEARKRLDQEIAAYQGVVDTLIAERLKTQIADLESRLVSAGEDEVDALRARLAGFETELTKFSTENSPGRTRRRPAIGQEFWEVTARAISASAADEETTVDEDPANDSGSTGK